MSKALKVIGVAGQRRVGKDTLADYIAPRLVRKVPTPCHGGVTYMETEWARGSFAAAVKRIFCETFGKDNAFIEEWKVKNECPPGMIMPVREALTFIGDGFRKIQPDIWIETAFRTENDPFGKVFSDVRYVNEANKIKNNNGVNILVYRENKMNWDVSGSESEIRPYVMWCVATGREGAIADWPEVQAGDICPTYWQDSYPWTNDRYDEWEQFAHSVPSEMIEDPRKFFVNLAQFDLFIRSADGRENVHDKAEAIVLPYIRENFTYAEG